jgi:hypothetical protein
MLEFALRLTAWRRDCLHQFHLFQRIKGNLWHLLLQFYRLIRFCQQLNCAGWGRQQDLCHDQQDEIECQLDDPENGTSLSNGVS